MWREARDGYGGVGGKRRKVGEMDGRQIRGRLDSDTRNVTGGIPRDPGLVANNLQRAREG